MKYLLIGMLFISSALFAQSDQKSENILDKMSSEIKSLKSFYIEFTMNVKNPATGENSNQKGLGYVKGDKYYASLGDRKSTRLNSSHVRISYAVFCLKKKKQK